MELPARFLLAAWLTFIAVSPASAVVVNGGNGSGNTTAPPDDQGWSNVGAVRGASCVYLGDGWVITACHVGQSLGSNDTIRLNGVVSSPVPESLHRLTTTYQKHGVPSTASADLVMFQLATTPADLGGLNVAAGTYDGGELFTAIGYGRNRAADKTCWDAAWNETSSSAAYKGYELGDGSTKRWGTNTLVGARAEAVNDGYGITGCLVTAFDSGAGGNEMQAACGDSGGGVFVQEDGDWKLAGIILAIDGVGSQPSELVNATAVYGGKTYFADLRDYSGQIRQITAVPEPSSLALLAAGVVAAWLLRRRGGAGNAEQAA